MFEGGVGDAAPHPLSAAAQNSHAAFRGVLQKTSAERRLPSGPSEHLLHPRDLRAREGQGCSVSFTGVSALNLIFKFTLFLHGEKRSAVPLPEASGINYTDNYLILNLGACGAAYCWRTTSAPERPPSAFIGVRRTLNFCVNFDTKFLTFKNSS